MRAEADKVFIDYVPLSSGTGYVAPAVMLEFGARSTGEPSEPRPVTCDAAKYLPMLGLPEALPQVMRAERTFWEKATAIHVFCAQGYFRGGERYARHWHDVARLDTAGHVDNAIADAALGRAVAEHKSIFFAKKTLQGNVIDYHAAVSGNLQLVPNADALVILEEDYRRMVDDGLFLNDAESFDVLMARCQAIQDKANLQRPGHSAAPAVKKAYNKAVKPLLG